MNECVILKADKPYSQIEIEIKDNINSLKAHPKLISVIFSDDPSSLSYVKSKAKITSNLGIEFELLRFKKNENLDNVRKIIHQKIELDNVDGIIFERPYPEIYSSILDEIPPLYDIDGASIINLGNLAKGNPVIIPATPQASLYLLDYYNIPVAGKNVSIIGRSQTVGIPLFLLLSSKNKNATVTLCHSKTKDINGTLKNADIIFVAIGKPLFLKSDMVNENAVIIDIGINVIYENQKRNIVGDTDYNSLINKVSAISPVPGGVGLLTPLFLIKNLLKSIETRKSKIL